MVGDLNLFKRNFKESCAVGVNGGGEGAVGYGVFTVEPHITHAVVNAAHCDGGNVEAYFTRGVVGVKERNVFAVFTVGGPYNFTLAVNLVAAKLPCTV